MCRSGMLGAGLALAFSAAAALAQDAAVPEDRVAILVAAIEAAGCYVNEANEAQVLAATGMGEGEASVIVTQLMNTGRAEPFGDDLKLTTGNCN